MADDKRKDISKMSHKEFLAYQADLERGGAGVSDRTRRDIERIEQNFEEAHAIEAAKEILRDLGVDTEALDREMKIMEQQSTAGKPEDLQKFLDAIKAGNAAKAKKYKNKKQVRDAAKRARAKKGWCSLILIAIVMMGAVVIWGMYEGINAIASVLF